MTELALNGHLQNGRKGGVRRPLRFVTFLAPNMLPVYEFICRYFGERLNWPTCLSVGYSYENVDDQADVCFLCGLAYVQLAGQKDPPLEPLAAPVFQGARYVRRPVYFSDVIVHRNSSFQSFADLRGRSWSYNEPHSQSGYGIVGNHLIKIGETDGFFGEVVEAGWHERSLHLVATGKVDASAIDSQVLTVAFRDDPELVSSLRIIDSFGPSTSQPVAVSRRLSTSHQSRAKKSFGRNGQ